jgi:hypothetical protein
MRSALVYQQMNDDYIDKLDSFAVVGLIRQAIERAEDGVYGHVYYGPVASTSPILNFAIFGSGVFLTINLDPARWPSDSVSVFEASDDYVTTHKLCWGQDQVTIPGAFCLPVPLALRIIEQFCQTGTKTDDPRWRDYYRVKWDWYGSRDA